MIRGRPAALVALVIAAASWGSAATFIKFALDSWGPMTLLIAQLLSANVVLWTILLIRGYRLPPRMWRLLLPEWVGAPPPPRPPTPRLFFSVADHRGALHHRRQRRRAQRDGIVLRRHPRRDLPERATDETLHRGPGTRVDRRAHPGSRRWLRRSSSWRHPGSRRHPRGRLLRRHRPNHRRLLRHAHNDRPPIRRGPCLGSPVRHHPLGHRRRGHHRAPPHKLLGCGPRSRHHRLRRQLSALQLRDRPCPSWSIHNDPEPHACLRDPHRTDLSARADWLTRDHRSSPGTGIDLHLPKRGRN